MTFWLSFQTQPIQVSLLLFHKRLSTQTKNTCLCNSDPLPLDTYNIHLQVSPVAAHDAAVKSGAMSQILLWVTLFEILSIKVRKKNYTT